MEKECKVDCEHEFENKLVLGIESQALLPTEIFTVLSDEFSE